MSPDSVVGDNVVVFVSFAQQVAFLLNALFIPYMAVRQLKTVGGVDGQKFTERFQVYSHVWQQVQANGLPGSMNTHGVNSGGRCHNFMRWVGTSAC